MHVMSTCLTHMRGAALLPSSLYTYLSACHVALFSSLFSSSCPFSCDSGGGASFSSCVFSSISRLNLKNQLRMRSWMKRSWMEWRMKRKKMHQRPVCRGRCVNCPTVICIYIIQNTTPNALLTMMIQVNSHKSLSTFTFIKTFSFTDSSNRDLISWTDVSAVNQCYRYYLPGINCTCALFG